MIVNAQKSSTKMFQKPNILRKKPKGIDKIIATEAPQSSEAQEIKFNISSPSHVQEKIVKKVTKHKCSKPCHSIRKPAQRIRLDSYICEEYRIRKLQDVEAAENVCKGTKGLETNFNNNHVDGVLIQNVIYANSLIGNTGNHIQNDANNQSNTVEYIQDPPLEPQAFKIELLPPQDGHLNLVNSQEEEAAGQIIQVQVGSELMTLSIDALGRMPCPLSACGEVFLTIDAILEHLPMHSSTDECDWPTDSKLFVSEQKVKQPKSAQTKESSEKVVKPAIECPARTVDDGRMQRCDCVFPSREELLKHIKDDHTAEEAPYRCEMCSRHFFWLSGLRAHVRSHASKPRVRTLHACPWPGCSRVFLQACRLKEHSRAHTGDKPYVCHYPNCCWAFRTASKLLRHARRHTGERRHTCALCGRAFLRAEHLREHESRHAQPHARRRHACTQPGCEQTFNNKSSLYLHAKKVHQPRVPAKESVPSPDTLFMISEIAQSCKVVASPEPESHAARTHCTWPLEWPRGAVGGGPASDSEGVGSSDQSSFVLHGDIDGLQGMQVELTESSESNVYTVRSDLFLHGNTALHHEDSQQSGVLSEAVVGSSMELVLLEETHALDSMHLGGDLGLLDSTPIDLMQEELLYTDSAVDGSSFPVLLLSGEEAH